MARKDDGPCTITWASTRIPGHTHSCAGNHRPGGDHFCPDCRRRWWWYPEELTDDRATA